MPEKQRAFDALKDLGYNVYLKDGVIYFLQEDGKPTVKQIQRQLKTIKYTLSWGCREKKKGDEVE